jgi:hypothetical protein
MRLSNLWPPVLFFALLAPWLHGCGGTQTVEKTAFPATPQESKRFPFSLREPDVFQADVIVISMGEETRYFVARKGTNSRLDFFRDGKLVTTELGTDAVYSIDHAAKTYEVAQTGSSSPPAISDVGRRLFQRGLPYRYDELDRQDGIVRYKAREVDIVVSIDEATGLMVRQEFSEDGGVVFAYELRNIELDVDDSVFSVPLGYKQIK